MQRSKWAIGFKAIVLILAFIVAGIFYIYRGGSAGSLKELLLGLLLLLIGGVIFWISVSVTEYANKPFDEKIDDTEYIKLRTYFRETLLPLAFEEKQEHGGIGFSTTYSQGELTVQLGKDIRDNYYFFQAANKSDVIDGKDKTFKIPKFDFTIGDDAKNMESFKSKVQKKLPEWLTDQNIK